MQSWIGEHRGDQSVRVWLAENEPPPEWEGSRMEYAYTEMPRGSVLRAVLMGGLVIGLALFANRPAPAPIPLRR